MTTRPFYWSVRRELWENRSLLIVPAGAAILALALFIEHLPGYSTLDLDGSSLRAACQKAADLLSLLYIPLGLFYSLDALHGERRDRSILFWKSLPVSDRIVVLSKAVIPLVLLPLIIFAAIVAIQAVMMVLAGIAMLTGGGSAMSVWTDVSPLRLWVELFCGIGVLALWLAPIHAWLLLVSGWARRSVLLWAIMLPLAVCLVEKLIVGSGHLASLLLNRLTAGVLGDGLFAGTANLSWLERLTMLSPAHLASDPDLWLGLIPAALLLAGAAASRRYRQPL
jgi:ABC-2 type transport system permease protein